MSKPIERDLNQTFLLPPSIEDWLPDNHPARYINDFVDAIDLEELGISQIPSWHFGMTGSAIGF